MARGKLFLILILFLHSCAEVIPLTGGDRDVFAPKPELGKQQPEQGAIGFSGSELLVTFDEYFTLNDPSKTIEMNPSCGTISVEQKNKTLRIKWSEALQTNTTYSLILDGTVVDLTEKNDTIHQFVFSTGLGIDTAKISGKCVDAFSNGLLGNCTIYLFEQGKNPKVDKPKFKTRSNKFGGFSFSYLPMNSTYDVFAFNDFNKNATWDINEKVAFYSGLNSSDSLLPTLYFYKESNSEQKLNATISEPGKVILTGNEVEKTIINGQKIRIFQKIKSDSLIAFLPKTETTYQFILANDTVVKSAKNEKSKLQLKSSLTKLRIGDTLRVYSSDSILSIDNSKLSVFKGEEKLNTEIKSNADGFYVIIPNSFSGDYKLKIEREALMGLHANCDSTQMLFSVLKETELATLKLKLENFESNVIVELIENNQVVYSTIKKADDQTVNFTRLIPGNYTIRCVEDKNGDGKWTEGSLVEQRQPEHVFYYKLTQKLRPNWEIEQTLQKVN
jgi:hypothetical protein